MLTRRGRAGTGSGRVAVAVSTVEMPSLPVQPRAAAQSSWASPTHVPGAGRRLSHRAGAGEDFTVEEEGI